MIRDLPHAVTEAKGVVIRCFMPRVPTYLTVPAAKQHTLDLLELQLQLFWEVDEVIIIQLRTHLVAPDGSLLTQDFDQKMAPRRQGWSRFQRQMCNYFSGEVGEGAVAAGLPAARKRSQGARKAAAKKRREGSREEREVAQAWQPHQAGSSSGYQPDAGWGGR